MNKFKPVLPTAQLCRSIKAPKQPVTHKRSSAGKRSWCRYPVLAIGGGLMLVMAGCSDPASNSVDAGASQPKAESVSQDSTAQSADNPAKVALATPATVEPAEAQPQIEPQSSVEPQTLVQQQPDPPATKKLDLSLKPEELLGEQGQTKPSDGVMLPSQSSLALGKAAEAAEDGLSVSGGLLTKENEPDYRNSVEGAKVGFEMKY